MKHLLPRRMILAMAERESPLALPDDQKNSSGAIDLLEDMPFLAHGDPPPAHRPIPFRVDQFFQGRLPSSN